MNKLLTALIAGLLVAPAALADPEIYKWKSHHSMGCMLLRECQEDTWRVYKTEDIEQRITHANYDDVREETDAILAELDKMGVQIFLAADKYFTRGVAGTYHAKVNNFYLNDSYADDPVQMLRTLRHEAWHAAQDAMAGTIDNTMMAVIVDDATIPQDIKLMVEIAYPPSARPWEQEAKLAGRTKNMTLDVLKIINATDGKPWTALEPTPLTREWLEKNGYM